LDANRNGNPTSPSENSIIYGWPIKLILLILAVQFTMGGYIKVVPGMWFQDWQTMQNLVISHHLGNPNPPQLAIWAATIPTVGWFFQLGGVLFEGLFFLALVNRPLRLLFVAGAVLFHVINIHLLGFGFEPFNIIYLLFLLNWQRAFSWITAPWQQTMPQVPYPHMVGFAFAVGFTLLWVPLFQGIFVALNIVRWSSWVTRIAAIIAVVQAAYLTWTHFQLRQKRRTPLTS
ncbi:MAG: hypothetical protein AAF125_19470, partial [Chloroflexota bacterium]